jgi:hypothetical protein
MQVSPHFIGSVHHKKVSFGHAFLVLLSSCCNDQALAHIKLVHAGAQDMVRTHIWQGTPARPSSQESSRDKSSMEVAHQEEKTTAILDGL